MFGKVTRVSVALMRRQERRRVASRGFQSPCAGNMFGKVWSSAEIDDLRALVAFQSPCAGNMFGKKPSLCVGIIQHEQSVSIPVCGEHVW